jgi:hypothetical protein
MIVIALVMVAVTVSVLLAHSAGDHGARSRRSSAAADRVPVTVPSVPHSNAGPVVSDIGTTGSFLLIPSLGVDAPLVPTGATGRPETASLTIPGDVHTAAWWDGTVSQGSRITHEDAPAPGQPGVAVIAGHIDSARAGPGALYDLKNISVGATVEIVDSGGHVAKWTVSTRPLTTRKTALPSSLWVTRGRPTLALVTCGGPFDRATGHYLDNVIVWATPAAT